MADGDEDIFRGQFLWVCDEDGKNCRNIPWKGTQDGAALIREKSLIAQDSFTEADLENDKITALPGTKWDGLNIYNDSEANNLTFTLKNNANTVFSFTLKPGEYLKNEEFNPFNIIEIAGTNPNLRIIVKVK